MRRSKLRLTGGNQLFDDNIFSQLQATARDQGCEHLLSSYRRGCLERMLQVQLRKSKGKVPKAVWNLVIKLKEVESAVEALHEHERLMDKDFFEMLVKSDSFLVRGKQKETGYPLYWARSGFPLIDAWKIRAGSRKAHAFIRYYLFVHQVALARFITEGLYASGTANQSFVFITDCVRLLRTSNVNSL